MQAIHNTLSDFHMEKTDNPYLNSIENHLVQLSKTISTPPNRL